MSDDPGDHAIEVIDAHHHIWDLRLGKHPWLGPAPPIPFRYGDYSAIKRDYLAAEYRRDAGRFRLTASVYVEAEWDPRDPIGETRWVHRVAETDRLPNAMVAQAWLDRDDVAEVLAKQAAHALVRSVRHKPRSARTPGEAQRGAAGSMDCPRWREGFAMLRRHGLHFDLQTAWWHFDAAADLAADFPDTTIIVNHTGLPADRSPEGIAGWRAALQGLARHDNVRLKISGIGVRGQKWTPQLNAGVVLDAISIFGATRCMFASNFPVDSLVATFDEIFDGFLEITRQLPAGDRARLFCETARETYRPITLGAAAPA